MSNIHNLRSAVLDYIAILNYFSSSTYSYNMVQRYSIQDRKRGRNLSMYMLIPYNSCAMLPLDGESPFPKTSHVFSHCHDRIHYVDEKIDARMEGILYTHD